MKMMITTMMYELIEKECESLNITVQEYMDDWYTNLCEEAKRFGMTPLKYAEKNLREFMGKWG